MPVKTIARPASSAAAITSSSRIEPPGWITAVAPASTAASRPSAKGKKASEATAEPIVRGSAQPALSAASFAFHAAMRARFEAVHLARADAGGGAVLGIDDRVRLDVLGDGPGERQSASSCSVGWRLVTTFRSSRLIGHCRASGPAQPPAIDFSVRPGRAGSGRSPVSSRRRFFFAANTARAVVVGVGRDDDFGEDPADRLARSGRRAGG